MFRSIKKIGKVTDGIFSGAAHLPFTIFQDAFEFFNKRGLGS